MTEKKPFELPIPGLGTFGPLPTTTDFILRYSGDWKSRFPLPITKKKTLSLDDAWEQSTAELRSILADTKRKARNKAKKARQKARTASRRGHRR